MQRPFRHLVAVIILGSAALCANGCTDEGVGDPCIPEAIPCDPTGKTCGYKSTESYLEASSVQCRSRLCLVYRLDNATGDTIDSDPRKTCISPNNPPGCVTTDQLNDSVYCTCRCGGGNGSDNCECPSGYACQTILTQGGAGIVGDYCVKAKSSAQSGT